MAVVAGDYHEFLSGIAGLQQQCQVASHSVAVAGHPGPPILQKKNAICPGSFTTFILQGGR
jgi:hypothetical protein